MMMGKRRKGTLVVDFETESKEHSKEAEGFGGGCVLVATMLYVGDNGKGKRDERKEVKKAW